MTQEENICHTCKNDPAQRDDCRCTRDGKNCINTHFTLALVAVIFSCAGGFFSIAIALAALILSLRAQDLIKNDLLEEAKSMAFWSALFSWLTILIAILPIIAVFFFGGAILAALGAILAAA
ncbi:hypothetical protein [Candidatus Avelusimicrobium aviculae]|uniref:hypothetical protein n=1 Tax=Candidatus Avelusimicrobium aviculae TaxID=3416206 RepID=UPI003D0D74D9